MKKSIYKFMKYDVYKYAPESFKLFLVEGNKRQQIELPEDVRSDLGYTVITKGEVELEKEVKKYFRKKSMMRKQLNRFKFCVRIKDSIDYVTNNITVKQYNIQEHLWAYKTLKESLDYSKYKSPIKTTSATLDGNYKPTNVQDNTDILKLSNRVYLEVS